MRIQATTREAAEELIRRHKEDPSILKIYLFPSEVEIRLIEVDELAPVGTQARPFYFGAMPAEGVPYASAIAIIRPSEVFDIDLPEGWGIWGEAELLWERSGG